LFIRAVQFDHRTGTSVSSSWLFLLLLLLSTPAFSLPAPLSSSTTVAMSTAPRLVDCAPQRRWWKTVVVV